MKLKIDKLNLDLNRRILITSDIHGGLEEFQEALQMVNYSNEDYLFILGDIIERGSKSLETLRYVMDLVSKGNTYVLMGNNDLILDDIKYDKYVDKFYHYASTRNSIYNDMCKEIGITLNENILEINYLLRKHFSKEIDFVCNLPHIIETNKMLFAHAGVTDFNNLENNSAIDVMTIDRYLDNSKPSPKLLFIGHYPSMAYSSKYLDLAPYRNFKKKTISIDGGFSVKQEGQINVLIIKSENNVDIDFIYNDKLPKMVVIESQEESLNPVNVVWEREKISLIEKGDKVSKCLVNDKTIIDIPNMFLYYKNDQLYCSDYTDYYLHLEVGDIVKYICSFEDKVLVKKETIVGWVSSNKIREI